MKFLCLAFLISPQFAITTAHCLRALFIDYSPPQIFRLGNADISADKVSRVDAKINNVVIHPQYKSLSKSFDIGLVELETALPLTKSIQPACLWSQPSMDGVEFFTVPGWSQPETSDDRTKTLVGMRVQRIDSNTCMNILNGFSHKFNKIEDHHVCANESISEIQLCRGYSGSPLIAPDKLDDEDVTYAYAMAAYGTTCGSPQSLGVYIKMASFIDWIETIVWKDEL